MSLFFSPIIPFFCRSILTFIFHLTLSPYFHLTCFSSSPPSFCSYSFPPPHLHFCPSFLPPPFLPPSLLPAFPSPPSFPPSLIPTLHPFLSSSLILLCVPFECTRFLILCFLGRDPVRASGVQSPASCGLVMACVCFLSNGVRFSNCVVSFGSSFVCFRFVLLCFVCIFGKVFAWYVILLLF